MDSGFLLIGTAILGAICGIVVVGGAIFTMTMVRRPSTSSAPATPATSNTDSVPPAEASPGLDPPMPPPPTPREPKPLDPYSTIPPGQQGALPDLSKMTEPNNKGKPWLDGVGGMVAGQRIKVELAETIIGRSRVCDIQFHDPKVSRQHAMLRLHNGRYFIQDMQSSRGTLVNKHKVETQMLQDGDEIRLGDSVVVFRLPKESPS